MNESYLSLNLARKVSIFLLLLPVFIGGYIEENFGINSTVFLILVLIPFYFIGFKNFIESIKFFLNLRYARILILYLIFCIISLSYSQDINTGISSIRVISIAIIIGLFLSHYRVVDVYKYLAWSGLIFSVTLYLNIPQFFLDYYTESQRFGYYHGEIQLNPNYFSILLNFIGLYFLFKLITANTKLTFILNSIPLCLTFIFLIETQSRSGLFTFVIVVLFSFMLKRNSYTIIFGSFLTALIFLLLFLNVNFDFQSRLSEADLNNRDNNWEIALKKSIDNPTNFLFGYGIGSAELLIGENANVYTVIDEQGRARANAHNMYLENLLNIGVFGLVLFLLFFMNLIIYAQRNFEYVTSYLPLLITVIILISGTMGNQMRSYQFMIIFSIVIGFTIQKFNHEYK